MAVPVHSDPSALWTQAGPDGKPHDPSRPRHPGRLTPAGTRNPETEREVSPMKRITLALLAALLPATVFAQEVSGKLVLYTSQPNTDAQQTIDAFKAKHPKVDVSFVRDGTPRILAKLRAEFEAGQPQADLLLIADSVTMMALA